jgi:hypothetical protein
MKLIITLLFLTLLSCGQNLNNDGGGGRESSQLNGLTCACTAQYAPVCALNGNNYVTYSNACMAQCDGVDYINGACDGTQSNVNGQSCNSNSGPVCGQIQIVCNAGQVCTGTQPAPKYFSNECEMKVNNAVEINDQYCP